MNWILKLAAWLGRMYGSFLAGKRAKQIDKRLANSLVEGIDKTEVKETDIWFVKYSEDKDLEEKLKKGGIVPVEYKVYHNDIGILIKCNGINASKPFSFMGVMIYPRLDPMQHRLNILQANLSDVLDSINKKWAYRNNWIVQDHCKGFRITEKAFKFTTQYTLEIVDQRSDSQKASLNGYPYRAYVAPTISQFSWNLPDVDPDKIERY